MNRFLLFCLLWKFWSTPGSIVEDYDLTKSDNFDIILKILINCSRLYSQFMGEIATSETWEIKIETLGLHRESKGWSESRWKICTTLKGPYHGFGCLQKIWQYESFYCYQTVSFNILYHSDMKTVFFLFEKYPRVVILD